MSRMDFWRILGDPSFRSILSLVAVCTTIIIFIVGQWWWRRKALTYTVSTTRLLSVHSDVLSRIQILFDGVPASDVVLVLMTITNSGHEPIRTSDFERALTIHFGDEARLLDMEVGETKPQNLDPSVKKDEKEYTIQPLLLNKGDSITVKALVSKLGMVKVDGRIAGVRITHADATPFRSPILLLYFVLLAAGFISDALAGQIWGVPAQAPMTRLQATLGVGGVLLIVVSTTLIFQTGLQFTLSLFRDRD